MTHLDITTTFNEHDVLLHCQGRLDANHTSYLNDAIEQLVRDGHYHIKLDFEALDYLSSAGIRLLMVHYKTLLAVNGRLSLSTVSEPVAQILQMVGLSNLLAGETPQTTASTPKAPSSPEITCHQYHFSLTPLPGEGHVQAVFFGEPEHTATADYQAEHAHSLQAGDKHYALGIGAIGSSYEACKHLFGECLLLDGNIAYQPSDGSNHPDYLINSGQLVATLTALYGIRFTGDFAALVRFKGENGTDSLGLSQLIEGVSQLVDTETFLMISIAEISGLVGMALNHPPVDGRSLFSYPEIKETLHVTTEPSHTRMLALNLGFFSRNPQETVKRYTRPLCPDSDWYSHVHTAVFPYRPLKKTGLDVHETIRSLFDEGSLTSLLHLAYDNRDIVGLGESRFVQGYCWIAPVTTLQFNPLN